MDSPHDAPKFHDDAQLCQYLLGSITTIHSLEIRQSEISQAGSGLFTLNAVPEGAELYRSSPVVECVADGLVDGVCDFCYANTLSRVHPSGRFRTKDDAPLEMIPCRAGCGKCYYCSKSCQDKAWEAYHKHECDLLLKLPASSAKTRALYRALVLEKNGILPPEEDWKAITRLETHQENRLSGPDATSIEELAMTAKERTGTSLDVTEISRLYCAILTNSISIRESGQAQVLGTALDVPMALMNHSCEPNALTIFEGSELRVRSLRPIQAGEELMQCYTDVTCDVLIRRERLKEQFFFDCACARCEREFKKHKRRTLNDMSEVEFVHQAQKSLTNLINNTIMAMQTSRATATSSTIDDDDLVPPLTTLEARARSLINDAFPASRWPDTLDPVPLLYKRLGNMHSVRGGSGTAALRCGVKGCAYTTPKSGPDWVYDLHDLVRLLTGVVVQPASRAAALRDRDFLSFARSPASRDGKNGGGGGGGKGEFWDEYHGLLYMLLGAAERTFGSDAAYARAVRTWYDDVLEGAEEEELPSSPSFAVRSRAAHRKLLFWAGVEEWQWPVE